MSAHVSWLLSEDRVQGNRAGQGWGGVGER